MTSKQLLVAEMQKVQQYADNCLVGTNEYNDAFDKLMKMRKELAELERTSADFDFKDRELKEAKKERRSRNAVEYVKFIGGSIIMPCIGLVAVTKLETEVSFGGAFHKIVDCFNIKDLRR